MWIVEVQANKATRNKQALGIQCMPRAKKQNWQPYQASKQWMDQQTLLKRKWRKHDQDPSFMSHSPSDTTLLDMGHRIRQRFEEEVRTAHHESRLFNSHGE